jgi:5,10-methylenetetrahydrofolate reductase
VLCIRGEHQAVDKSDTPRLRELIGHVCEVLPDALVGATLNPYGPRRRVLENLLPKLRAGASYVQTQLLFDLATLVPFAEEVKAHAPLTRIVPMVMPLLSLDAALRLRERIGIPLPPALLAHLEAEGEPGGWAALRETVRALRASPLVDGVAVMTLEADPPSAVGRMLRAILRE